jgi:hypothetical protein
MKISFYFIQPFAKPLLLQAFLLITISVKIFIQSFSFLKVALISDKTIKTKKALLRTFGTGKPFVNTVRYK